MAYSLLGLLMENGLKPGDSYDKALQIMSSIDGEELKKFSDGFGGYDMSDVISACKENVNKSDDVTPKWIWILLMMLPLLNSNNDSYYRGKADAYERILGDLLEENVSKSTS